MSKPEYQSKFANKPLVTSQDDSALVGKKAVPVSTKPEGRKAQDDSRIGMRSGDGKVEPISEKSENKYKDREDVLEGLSSGYSSALKALSGKMKGLAKGSPELKMLQEVAAQVLVLQVQCQKLIEIEKDRKAGKSPEADAQSEPKKATERANIGAILEIEKQFDEVRKQVKEIKDLGAKPEVSIKVQDGKVTATVEARMPDGGTKSIGELRADNAKDGPTKERSPLAAGAPTERPGTSPTVRERSPNPIMPTQGHSLVVGG